MEEKLEEVIEKEKEKEKEGREITEEEENIVFH
jgi:hypothetical protein